MADCNKMRKEQVFNMDGSAICKNTSNVSVFIMTVFLPPTHAYTRTRPGHEVIKLFSCSTQLSIKVFLLINVKMPTMVGILTFISMKSSILGLSEPEKKVNFLIFLYL